MRVTKKQAEDFVHFGEDHYSNLKIMKDMVCVFWGMAWVLWIPFCVAGRGLVFSVVITVLALLYNVAFCFLKSNLIKKTYRLRFITSSIFFLFIYMFFYLFGQDINTGGTFSEGILSLHISIDVVSFVLECSILQFLSLVYI